MGRELERRDFEAMGLSGVWLEVLDQLGPERFLVVWQLLDRPELIEQEGRLRMTIPRYSRFLRWQRNRFIQALAAEGYEACDIQEQVRKAFGEKLSKNYIFRLKKE